MTLIDQTVSDIKSLKIQGASNILKASLTALKQLSLENPKLSFADLENNILLFQNARPTEPLTRNCLNLLLETVAVKQSKITTAIEDIEKLLSEIEEKTISNGVQIIKNLNPILTHCHSKTVLNILKALNTPELQVYNTETRPLFQGRITSTRLAENKIKVTQIIDAYAPCLINTGKIKVLLIGADMINNDGSVVNKVGSYGLSLSAWRENIPVYIASSMFKYSAERLEIEIRSPSEIWENPPQGVEILNPAFDTIPAKFITGLITEAGIIKPEEVSVKVRDFYPWIDKKI